MNSILKLNSPLNTKPRMSSIRQKATFFLCEKFFYLFMAFFHWKWRENLAWHRVKQIELFFLSFFFAVCHCWCCQAFSRPTKLKGPVKGSFIIFNFGRHDFYLLSLLYLLHGGLSVICYSFCVLHGLITTIVLFFLIFK